MSFCFSAALLGVFDGHMGILASKFCAKQLPIELVKELEPLFLPYTPSVAENTTYEVIADEGQMKCCQRISSSAENNSHPNEIPFISVTPTLKEESTLPSLVKRSREYEENAENENKKCKYLSQDLQAPFTIDGENVSAQLMKNNCLSSIEKNMEDAHVFHINEKTDELDLKFFQSSITKAFRRTDELFLQKHRLSKDGSTASIILLLGQHVFSAWLGDSRIILASKRNIRFREIPCNDGIERPVIDKEHDQKAEYNESSNLLGTQWVR
jgi:serine/threonine protein phosphatase PrpC